MIDLGTCILGNAKLMLLVFALVLQLKIVVPLCKWNKHKNMRKIMLILYRSCYQVISVRKRLRQVAHQDQPD